MGHLCVNSCVMKSDVHCTAMKIIMEIQSIYQQAILFAAAKHAENNQTIPGTNLPYVVHVSNVAMEILMTAHHDPEFDLALAIKLALLHDTLEDTSASFDEIARNFGTEIARGVAALTKNDQLPKAEQMADSLSRIRNLPKEVGMIKLADRITNLQEPPGHWSMQKIKIYLQEAGVILEQLKHCNDFLARRLAEKIDEYGNYCDITS